LFKNSFSFSLQLGGVTTVTTLRPWTLVLSEYLDLPFLLRARGESVVAVRSAREALDYLTHSSPSAIIVDAACYDSDRVVAFARSHCRHSRVEESEDVITRLLAAS
jgi:hypothetical protein